MKKPSATAIRGAVPLTRLPTRGDDPIKRCGICGLDVDLADLPATVWREHDEHDRPISGTDALVFLGQGSIHAKCRKVLDAHPRLYAEDSGSPGSFPRICSPCTHRRGLDCAHPDLTANGGPGLKITLTRLAAIVCSRGAGRHAPVREAVSCVGRRTLSLLSEAT